MRAAFKLMCTLAFVMLWAVTPALADVPTEISVQGRLTNGAGAPVPAGIKLFTFRIYDAPAGGVEIWPGGPGEIQPLATDANGLWNAGVGELIPLTEAVFQSPVRWLEVTVNDGVNPIEILPRIELRTNPYTYRAATSQHADSLGNVTYSDLVDQFVDEPGDTMTGPLGNYYTQKDLGSSIQSHNLNDGWFGNWNDFVGTWGISSAVGGDNSNWNVAVAASAEGNNNLIDGNYGVISHANGSGAVNYGILAQTGMSGTNNYSGYFLNGDFVVSGPQTAGTGGVLLPPDAIDNSEILDEPGIAFSASFAFTPLAFSNTATDFLTVSITIPSSGYVVVRGTATILFSGTTLANYAWMQIDQTAGGTQGTRYLWLGAGAHAGTGNDYGTASFTKVYSLGAGTHTFRLEGNGYLLNNVSATTNLYQAELMATFYSTSYGTVSALVADRGDFEDATLVKVNDPQGGTFVEAYAVDLRELELRAARTKAEAEKAQRELVEAKLSAVNGMVRSAGTSVKEPKR